jgi:iron complex transport system substrate-binding protein
MNLRIVSLTPANTEVLFALGLGGQMVGVTEHCDYPREAADKEKVGRFAAPDPALIIKLRPDLVVSGGAIHRDLAGELQQAGLKVFELAPHTVAELFTNMEELVDLAGGCQPGLQLISELRSRVDIIAEQRRDRYRPRAVFLLGHHQTIAVPGKASCIYDAFSILRLEQIPSDEDLFYHLLDWEDIRRFDPEILVACGASPYGPTHKRCPGCSITPRPCARTRESLLELPQLQGTAAVRKGAVETVPCHFFCRTGPRLIDGMEWLADKLRS